MQYRNLGTTTISTSVIGLGTWAIGGWMWGGTDEKESIKAIQAAVENGMNLVDTAPMYGFGRSEEIVGKAIRDRRDKVVLATKCGLSYDEKVWPEGKGVFHFYANEKGADPTGKKFRVYKYLRPDSIRKEVEESLKRLQTDYLDLLQTHWQDETGPIVDTMGTLLKLKEEGKIRAIGVSNISKEQLQEYLAVGPVDVVQERFSLMDREIVSNGILDICNGPKEMKDKISVLAYSPLCNGLLTGHMTPDRKFNEGDLRLGNPRFTPENIRKTNENLKRFQPLCEKYSLTVGQAVIAWTVSFYSKMHVLCGARNARQVEENLAGGNTLLTPDEVAQFAKVFE